MDRFDVLTVGRCLTHPVYEVRAAMQTKLLTGGASALACLKEILCLRDAAVSHAAFQVIEYYAEPDRFELLVHTLHARNPIVGAMAVERLEQYGEQAVGRLCDALPACHALVQLRVIAALECIGSRQAVPCLMDLLGTAASGSLRYTAIQALGVIGDPVAIDLIRSFADDEDHHVRDRVKIALERLNAPPT